MEEPVGACPSPAQPGMEGVGGGWVGLLGRPKPACLTELPKMRRPQEGRALGPGRRLPSPPLRSWLPPRSPPGPGQDPTPALTPVLARPGPAPCRSGCARRHTGAQPSPTLTQGSGPHTPPSHPLSRSLFQGGHTHCHAFRETQTLPWPTASLGQLPAGPHE